MQQPFLALITPLDSGPPPGGGGAPGYPTHPWVPPYGPAHPIAPGGLPGYPTHPWVPPWGPAHPISPGGPPLGIWGGGGVGNYPDAGFPGPQPGGPIGIWGGPYFPPVIWPGPGWMPGAEHPIAPGGPEGDRQPKIEWKTAWSPSTGWIVVGIPIGPTPTPSEDESKA